MACTQALRNFIQQNIDKARQGDSNAQAAVQRASSDNPDCFPGWDGATSQGGSTDNPVAQQGRTGGMPGMWQASLNPFGSGQDINPSALPRVNSNPGMPAGMNPTAQPGYGQAQLDPQFLAAIQALPDDGGAAAGGGGGAPQPGMGGPGSADDRISASLSAGGAGSQDQQALAYLTNNPDSWMAQAGFGYQDLAGMDMPRALRAYQQQQGLPDNWAASNLGSMQAAQAFDLLTHPGEVPGNVDVYGRLPEYQKLMDTPGQYVDSGSLYDSIFSGAAGAGGDGHIATTAQQLQGMPASQQVDAVMGAMGTLSPFINPNMAQDLQAMASDMAMDWQNAFESGQTTDDLLTYMYKNGAADWM